MKLTRGLVLGSALGMAAMAMMNKQAQNKATSNNTNTAATNNFGTTSTLGHISYDSSDKKYPSFSSSMSTQSKSSTSAPINAMSDEAVISDILK